MFFFLLHRSNSIFLTQPLYALYLDQQLINPYIAAAPYGKNTRIDGRLLGWITTASIPK